MNQTINTPSLEMILDSLGLNASSLENANEEGGIRIEFEQNFAIELQENHYGNCRISARVCKLGQSLIVQEQQLEKAMNILGALQDRVPNQVSLAVSTHDNCLRNVLEIPKDTTEKQKDELLNQFNEFLNFSFAYKQTYVAFGSSSL
jgi:hypothetical protein